MHGFGSLVLVVGLVIGSSVVRVEPVRATVAGTGQVTVTVNLGTQRLNISADFEAGPGLVDLGIMSATSVTLTGVDVATGASFSVPFANASNSFDAHGGVACPSGGCLAPASGPYAFVGFIDNIHASVLDPNLFYTFDGSATCSGLTTLTCSGPFAVNGFDADVVSTGASVAIQRVVSYDDPLLLVRRQFNARVVLTDVATGGDVVIAAVSRLRGTIPAPYTTDIGAFRGQYFDVSSTATFGSGRVCVEIDANQDGTIDGTNIPATRAAILHFTGGAFATVPLVFVNGFVCADALDSLSPFVLVVDGPPTTTSTSSTTSTSTSSTTSTSVKPPCSTARECLGEVQSRPLCEETINPKLQTLITKRTNAALAKLGKAAAATSATKVARFVKQARAALTAIQTKADKFVTKKTGAISSACRDSIRNALAPTLGKLDASQP